MLRMLSGWGIAHSRMTTSLFITQPIKGYAAGGQHEARLVLRSPVKDGVNKNSTEPQAAH